MSIKTHVGASTASFTAAFESGINAAFSSVIAATTSLTPSRSPHEPEYVYGLFRTALAGWDVDLNALFAGSGYRVNVGGVFCHQSTWVQWPPASGVKVSASTPMIKTRIEIGDLLVVFRLREPGNSENRALLLQSKKQAYYGALPSDDQYVLYHEWPTFQYATGSLRGQRRTVTGAPNAGGQYHLIDESLPTPYANYNWCRWAITGAASQVMASALTDMLMSADGEQFSLTPPVPKTDTWDQVIWDLLQVTYKGTATLKDLKAHGVARGFNCLVVGSLPEGAIRELGGFGPIAELPVAWFGPALPPLPPGEIIESNDVGEGISVIVIDIAKAKD